MDYWITDEVLHPPQYENEDPCSEERWRLDRCYVSYRPLLNAPAVQEPPCLKTMSIILAVSTKSQNHTTHCFQLDGCAKCLQLQTAPKK